MKRSVFLKLSLIVFAMGILIDGSLFYGMRSVLFPRRLGRSGY